MQDYETKAYTYHVAAEIFPMLSESETKKLARDIRARGLIHPILLYRDQILDGRNRYCACQIAGVAPIFRIIDLELDQQRSSPLEYVISLNLRRRQMTPSQSAMSAAAALPEWVKEGRQISAANLRRGAKRAETGTMRCRGSSDQRLAKIFGVSARYILSAKKLRLEHPELAQEVLDGHHTLSRALRIGRERSSLAVREKHREATQTHQSCLEILHQDVNHLADQWNRSPWI